MSRRLKCTTCGTWMIRPWHSGLTTCHTCIERNLFVCQIDETGGLDPDTQAAPERLF